MKFIVSLTDMCPKGQFSCDDGDRCIPDIWVCDGGFEDCDDKTDEIDCTCKNWEFVCGNTRCIPEENRCNGQDNCGDGTDEQYCDRKLLMLI